MTTDGEDREHAETVETSLTSVEGEDEESDDAEDVADEMYPDIPPQQRRSLTRMMASLTQVSGSVSNPLFDKITPEHLTSIIENVDTSDKRKHRYSLSYFFGAIAAILFMVVFLTIQDEGTLLSNIIAGILGFGEGFGVGRLSQ